MCQGINFWTNNKVPDVIAKTMLILWTTSFTTDKEENINTCGECFDVTQLNIFPISNNQCLFVIVCLSSNKYTEFFYNIYVMSLHKAHEFTHK